MTATNPIVPPACSVPFVDGIKHPELYLWDAWSYVEDDTIHLYCLALARTKPDGSELKVHERNDFPFHVRHFSSTDEGQSWVDRGCFQKPGNAKCGQDARNVWSGSIELLPDGSKLVGYTGIYRIDDERSYLQNISLAISLDGDKVDWLDEQPLSCPIRDHEQILAQGYYLDAVEKLGHCNGEAGGPVMAWRDPFIFLDKQNQIHIFWSAKSDPCRGIVAHALIDKTEKGYQLAGLYPPAPLPDGASFTQAEVPKVYRDDVNNRYYLVLASCNRLYEGQPDEEVYKIIRLYKSASLDGPWLSAFGRRNAIANTDGLFGMTVLKTDFANSRLLCMAPYTDTVEPELRLTFAAPFYVDLVSGRAIR